MNARSGRPPNLIRRVAHRVVWLILLSQGVGCDQSSVASRDKESLAAPARIVSGTLVDEATAELFAAQLLKAIRDDQPLAASRMMDWAAMVETAWTGLSTSKTAQADFSRGFLKQVEQPGGVMHSLAARVANGGRVDLLRTRVREGRRTVLIRILMDLGTNYMEFALEQQPDGTVRATDLYIYATAEWFSTTIRRGCIPIAAQADRTLVDRLLGVDQLMVQHLKTINRMVQAGKQQQWREVIAIYHTLPVELQRDKNTLLIRYKAASELLDEAEIVQAVGAIRREHPNDPCGAFLSVDYFTNRKEYAEALATVEQIDESVGGDPALLLMRANIQSQAGDEAGAEASARKLLNDNSMAPMVYSILFANAVRFDKFSAAVKWLDELHALTPLTPEDVSALPDNAGFIKSAEFLEWAARHQTKP